jgi:hypothetical protein
MVDIFDENWEQYDVNEKKKLLQALEKDVKSDLKSDKTHLTQHLRQANADFLD